jgi:hypothetical protein
VPVLQFRNRKALKVEEALASDAAESQFVR